MNTTTLRSKIISQEIRDLINYSKNSITNKIDPNLEPALDQMSRKIKKAIQLKKKSEDQTSLIYLKLLKKVIDHFYHANKILKELNEKNVIFEEIDTITELDILLNDLNKIISINPKDIDNELLHEDIKKIEELEDQKKRILMTYLMSDWKNLEGVLLLMKLGETYKDIADELYNISILIN